MSRNVSTLASPTGSPTIPLGDLRGVRILAVDDDADALSLVAELLDAAGAEVSTARSAEEALRQLDTRPAERPHR